MASFFSCQFEKKMSISTVSQCDSWDCCFGTLRRAVLHVIYSKIVGYILVCSTAILCLIIFLFVLNLSSTFNSKGILLENGIRVNIPKSNLKFSAKPAKQGFYDILHCVLLKLYVSSHLEKLSGFICCPGPGGSKLC